MCVYEVAGWLHCLAHWLNAFIEIEHAKIQHSIMITMNIFFFFLYSFVCMVCARSPLLIAPLQHITSIRTFHTLTFCSVFLILNSKNSWTFEMNHKLLNDGWIIIRRWHFMTVIIFNRRTIVDKNIWPKKRKKRENQ